MKTMGKLWRKTIYYLLILITIIILGAVIFSIYKSVYSLVAYGLVVLGSLFLLVSWQARVFAYRCVDCGFEFEISIWRDLISAHGVDTKGGWKYLRCPECGHWMKVRLLPKEHPHVA